MGFIALSSECIIVTMHILYINITHFKPFAHFSLFVPFVFLHVRSLFMLPSTLPKSELISTRNRLYYYLIALFSVPYQHGNFVISTRKCILSFCERVRHCKQTDKSKSRKTSVIYSLRTRISSYFSVF